MGYCFMDIKKIKSLNVMAGDHCPQCSPGTVRDEQGACSSYRERRKPSRLQRGVQTENGVFRVLQRPQAAE